MAELSITLKGSGTQKPPILLRRFSERMKPQLQKGLRQAGSHLTRTMKDYVGGAGFSHKGGGGRTSPYPGIVSGRLRSSIRFELIGGGWGMQTGPNVKYAPFVHDGWTQTVSRKQQRFLAAAKGIFVRIGSTLRSPPRPFVADAWKFQGRRALDMIQKTLMKAMDR